MRYAVVDFIRVVAIVLLLLGHILYWAGPYWETFGTLGGIYSVSFGGIAVSLFLVVSGLVLELNYREKEGYKDWIIRRLLRIYPIYFLSLAVGVFMHYLALIYTRGVYPSYSNLDLWHWLCSLVGFCAFFGFWGGPFLPTGWFVGLIVVLYFLFPFLSKIINRSLEKSLIMIFLFSVVSRVLLAKGYIVLPGNPLEWFPLARIFEFSFGIYLAIGVKRRIFLILNSYTRTASILKFFAELSFPLFLVHFQFLFLIKYLTRFGFSKVIGTLIFLAISVFVSYGILEISRQLQRKIVTRSLFQ